MCRILFDRFLGTIVSHYEYITVSTVKVLNCLYLGYICGRNKKISCRGSDNFIFLSIKISKTFFLKLLFAHYSLFLVHNTLFLFLTFEPELSIISETI